MRTVLGTQARTHTPLHARVLAAVVCFCLFLPTLSKQVTSSTALPPPPPPGSCWSTAWTIRTCSSLQEAP